MSPYEEVLKFWYEELTPKQWWVADEAVDAHIKERFAELHSQAKRCELWEWRRQADGRLAEIIVLDQFSRNLYRGLADAFAQDALALALAQEAVACGADQKIDPARRSFLYMPYMHSESLAIHKVGRRLVDGSQGTASAFDDHTAILERFGRYPHRNKVLGRESTSEEKDYLQDGSRFGQ